MRIFGLELSKSKQPQAAETANQKTVVPQDNGGAIVIEKFENQPTFSTVGSMNFIGNNFDRVFTDSKSRILFYRRMSRSSYVDGAVDEIVNEAITFDEEDGVVNINLDGTKFGELVKRKIVKEFDEILKLLNFDFNAADVFRQWYVDGQMYAHIVVDGDNTKDGILDIRLIDPTKIKKIIEIVKDKNDIEISRDEYYLYVPNADKNKSTNVVPNPGSTTAEKAYKLTKDSVVFVSSGIVDQDGNQISYLEPAIKPYNQLDSFEDAWLVYKISRSPEKRVFYIDTGDMPKYKAEQFIEDMITKYRNKAVYDSQSGRIDNGVNIQTMFQDFWIARQNDKTTEIKTLESTVGNFANPEEALYWLKKLFRAMKIPVSRVDSGQTVPFTKGSEITRDEIKFEKHISRLQNRFSELFSELLRTQLLLKNVITEEDWAENQYNVRFKFSSDSMYTEAKFTEVMATRMSTLQSMSQYIGKYYSEDWVKKNVLQMTEKEIESEQDKMNEENAAKKQKALDDATDPLTTKLAVAQGKNMATAQKAMAPTKPIVPQSVPINPDDSLV